MAANSFERKNEDVSKISCTLACNENICQTGWFKSRTQKNITHSFIKLRYFDCDQFRLLAKLKLVHLGFILDELTKDVGQEFLMIPRLGEVFTEPLEEEEKEHEHQNWHTTMEYTYSL